MVVANEAHAAGESRSPVRTGQENRGRGGERGLERIDFDSVEALNSCTGRGSAATTGETKTEQDLEFGDGCNP